MSATTRRLFLRPASLDDDAWKRVGELLADAVDRQRRLAEDSPHVLRYSGEPTLVEGGDAYEIAHEPVTPLAIAALFDRDTPPLQAGQLLRVSVGLFDALRAAHSASTAHGAVCPGVVTFALDGTARLTDFGFAAAVCEAAGVQACLNAAVGPGDPASEQQGVSGIWQILEPHRFDRSDRVCGFVDPEKYGRQTLNAFEPPSDIIGAAFVAHLLAEHQHPYLYADPDAHRSVEMSEFMAMGRFNGARRKDLRESTEPGVQKWCDLIAKCLSRLPADRPSAGEVVEALADLVPAADAGDALRLRLNDLETLAREGNWPEVQTAASALAAESGAPPDVLERANALSLRARATLQVASAEEKLGSDRWPEARADAEQALALSGLPNDLGERARSVVATVSASQAAQDAAAQARRALAKAEALGPLEALPLLERASDTFKRIPADPPPVPAVEAERDEAATALKERLEHVRPEAKALQAQDQAKADAWLDELSSAVEAEQWQDVERLISSRPKLRFWPESADNTVADAQRRLDEHHLAEKRRDAVERDRQAAEEWIGKLRSAVQGDDWDAAENLLAEKPRLSHWPDGVLDESNRLAADVRNAARQREYLQQARIWADELVQVVEKQDWNQATDLLAKRPPLADWPPDLLERITPYQHQVEQRVEAIELERRRQDQERRQATTWLDEIRAAHKSEDWEAALTLLETPPPVEDVPDDVREDAQKLLRASRLALGDQVLAELRRRNETILALIRGVVTAEVEEDFADLLSPDAVDVGIDASEYVSDHAEADGCAMLRLGLRGRPPESTPPGITFDFSVDSEPQRILDEKTLIQAIRQRLQQQLDQAQEAAASDFSADLRRTSFPEATVSFERTETAPTVPAEIAFLGEADPTETVDVELRWDPSRLQWYISDEPAVARRAWDLAVAVAADHLAEKAASAQPDLNRYRNLWNVQVDLPADDSLPDRLVGRARVTIPQGAPVSAQDLHSFEVDADVPNQAQLADDLAPAVDALRSIVTEAQQADVRGIETEFLSRIDRAGVKAKVEIAPRKIEEPVDSVTFTLKQRRVEPLSIIGEWDPQKLAFVLPGEWQAQTDDFLAGKASRPAARQEKTSDQKPGQGFHLPRRAVAVVGLIVILGGVVGGWAFWPRNGGDNVVHGPGTGNGSIPGSNGPLTGEENENTSDNSPARTQEGNVGETNTSSNANAQNSETPDNRSNGGSEVENQQQPQADPETEVENASDDNDTNSALEIATADLQGLNQRVEELRADLQQPTHAELLELAGSNRLRQLQQNLTSFATRHPVDSLDLSDTQAQELTNAVQAARANVERWQENVSAYAGAVQQPAESLDDQIANLQSAADLYETEYVTHLLEALPEIQTLLAEADERAENRDWLAAEYFAAEAQKEATNRGLGDAVGGTINAVRQRLATDWHNQIAPLIADARQWLDHCGAAGDAYARLGDIENATKARNRLDQLNLPLPRDAAPGEWVQKAVEQDLSPWPALTEPERATVGELLDRVTVSLPLTNTSGSPAGTIDVTFLPPAPARGMIDPVWMQINEMTVAQYRAVDGGFPTDATEELTDDLRNPVAFVPANGVVDLLGKVRERLGGRVPVRVPTADEWLHALEAGTLNLLDAHLQQRAFTSVGPPRFNLELANFESDEHYLFSAPGHSDGYGYYAPVRHYPPNQWGLYDMVGNVAEWVSTDTSTHFEAIGGSFLDRDTNEITEPGRLDDMRRYDNVGLRIVVLPGA